MITYNNIVTKFEQFVDAHFFVQTFSHGSPGDVDLDKLETYPLLHLVYTGGGYADNTKTYNLEVYILDNPPREGDKVEFQKATITQCEQAAEDILADIQNGGNIFQFGYDYDLLSANITPLEDERSNILAGSLLSLSIGVRYQYDACNAPLTGIDPDGTDLPVIGSVLSTWTATSSRQVDYTGTGEKVIQFGGINPPSRDLTITQDFRAGYTMGIDDFPGQTFAGLPLSIGSTFSVTFTCEVNAPDGAVALFQFDNKTGFMRALSGTAAIIDDGEWQTIQIVSSDKVADTWQLENTAQVIMNAFTNPGTISVRNPEITWTISHK